MGWWWLAAVLLVVGLASSIAAITFAIRDTPRLVNNGDGTGRWTEPESRWGRMRAPLLTALGVTLATLGGLATLLDALPG